VTADAYLRGVSEALLNEALWLLTVPGDKRISFPAKDRVALGPELVERCEGRTSAVRGADILREAAPLESGQVAGWAEKGRARRVTGR